MHTSIVFVPDGAAVPAVPATLVDVQRPLIPVTSTR